MNFVVIIPARFYSTRFPGKPLANINGKPMVVHVMENALMSGAEKVIVATDHIDIVQTIERENTSADVFLSQIDHRSGTARLEEVISKYGFSENQVIVNLQGDEPLISANMINLVASSVLFTNHINMSTLAVQISSIEEKYSENVVKVVVNIHGDALYFSRSMIPWCKKEYLSKNESNSSDILLLQHVGIYSYRVNFIHMYNHWEPSPLEKIEFLEQLRVLWYGKKIHVVVMDGDIHHINVDTPEELDQVNELFKKNEYIKD